MEDTLTPRQERIIRFIQETVTEQGYPPTVREIGDAVGLTSSSSVHSQLANLERMGLIKKDPSKPRAIGLADPHTHAPATQIRASSAAVDVPLLGSIAAGPATLAEQTADEVLTVPADLAGPGELFALRIAGDSMIRAGIYDGDTVIIHRQDDANDGDIVAAVMPGPAEDEATVKRLRKQGGRIMLVPENPSMMPFELTEGRILGRVTAVLRKL